MPRRTKTKARATEAAWEPFDDCVVCQAMKFAEERGRYPSLEELRNAFKEAVDGGAMVGGDPRPTDGRD